MVIQTERFQELSCNAAINLISNRPPNKPPGRDLNGAKPLPSGQSLYTETLPHDKTRSQKPHPMDIKLENFTNVCLTVFVVSTNKTVFQ